MASENAVVFGGSRGLGKALVELLPEHGYTVTSASRTTGCDASEYSHVLLAKRQAGPCSLVINCACSIEPIARMDESAPRHWIEAAAASMAGCYNVLRAFLPDMKRQGHGTIINISSGAGKRPIEGWSAYCTGKAAVEMATQCAQQENPELRILAVDPGVIDTDMQTKIRAADLGVVVPKSSLQTPAAAALGVLNVILSAKHIA